jgi:uncharacterized protein (DUF488 family)
MIYTIGHSNHPIERFIALLRQHEITAVADVRSTPYSRFNPQFSREPLKKSLTDATIHYVYLGEELGARSKDPACYDAGRVNFHKLAQTELFKQGLERLRTGMAQYKIALMCAEKEPLDCHRTILVTRELTRQGIPITHILDSGKLELHDATLARLRERLDLPAEDLFRSQAELIEAAYDQQAGNIAYVEPTTNTR